MILNFLPWFIWWMLNHFSVWMPGSELVKLYLCNVITFEPIALCEFASWLTCDSEHFAEIMWCDGHELSSFRYMLLNWKVIEYLGKLQVKHLDVSKYSSSLESEAYFAQWWNRWASLMLLVLWFAAWLHDTWQLQLRHWIRSRVRRWRRLQGATAPPSARSRLHDRPECA